MLTRDFLLFLFALYFAQGSLYPTGSLISQGCLLFILIISGIFFAKTLLLKEEKNLFFKAWTILLLLNIIGFIVTANFADATQVSVFKSILVCMLPFYPFYYFSRMGQLNSSHLTLFLMLMIPITVLQFFTNQKTIMTEFDSENVVNNIAYSFVRLMPFVFLFKSKKLIAGSIMVLLMAFIIQGAKRGAIMTGAIGLLTYFYYQIKTVEKSKRIRGYFIGAIVIVILSAFAYETFINNEFLINRMLSMLEGNTSGRSIIYSKIWESWYNSGSFINLLFGFGFAGSLVLTGGHYAHNDWLELLSNFGLLGFFAYLFMFYAVIRIIVNKKWILEKRIILFAIVAMWLLTTMGSMWYTSLDGYTQAILLAYLIGGKKNKLE